MKDLKQAHLMLRMAQKELKALKGMREPEIFEDEIFGFHAQQAIEKMLKAWIALSGLQYPLTHNIGILLDILQKHGIDLNKYWNLVDYNIYAVLSRYEEIDLSEKPLDRSATIEEIEELFVNVEKMLKDA
ncbi:MAG: HEPN domain-containing protein [Gemmatimonadota bacterium]|nr:HEPN domain-containing protein [Gemmatimonadota bacterium]